MKKNISFFYFLIGIFIFQFVFLLRPVKAANSDYLFQILSTGQSLSIGSQGTPALTTTQPYSNKMLDCGNTLEDCVADTQLVPLVEPPKTLQNTQGETISSAMANSLSKANGGNDFKVAVTVHGYGGAIYELLKKGTPYYNLGISQLNIVHSRAAELGKTHKVIGITTIHGESDEAKDLPSETYKADLIQWQSDYETDVKAVTGQGGTIPLYTDQTSSHTWAGNATPHSAIGQLAAAEENLGKIILVCPKYFLTYNSGAVHLINSSYRLLGEYYGKVINQVFNEGKQWLPLTPTSILRKDNIILAKFHIPEPATKIEFDTTSVDATPNKGFEYFVDSVNETSSITNVEIVTNDTVKITLDASPSESSSQSLAYAFTGTPGLYTGAHVAGSAKGNLRDDDPTLSEYDSNTHLYNWAVHFYKDIKLDTSLTSTSSTPTASPTAGTYTSAQSVTLSTATSGAKIYYTTNGDTPTTGSTEYTGAINIATSTTLKAIAVKNGMLDSGVMDASYEIKVATPTASPAAGTYTSAQSVTLSTTTSGAKIYYTTNGDTPTAGSTEYTGAINIATNTTLKAIAIKSGITNSNVMTASYEIKVATPTASPAAGTYTSAQSVTLSTTTSGAEILYTIDGSNPGLSCSEPGPGQVCSLAVGTNHYSGEITVSSNTTLKAIARKNEMTNSEFFSGSYIIDLPGAVATPTASPVAGKYTSAKSVALSTTTPEATIYYTTNGDTPTAESTEYTGAINISNSTTLKAIAVKNGMTDSGVFSGSYTIAEEHDSHKKVKKKKYSIYNSQKNIKRGQVLIQRGRKFSKKSIVKLYFEKPGGGYYEPTLIKTNKEGYFSISYLVTKPEGKYSWYAVDTKTGRKSKTIKYIVR